MFRTRVSTYETKRVQPEPSSDKGLTSSPQRPDCVAGVRGLELRNVAANYPFERSHRFAGIQPNSGYRDYSRLSCGMGIRSSGLVLPGPPTVAAKRATSVIPIVFAAVGDPVGAGVVESLARPGGNAIGLSLQQTDAVGKRLELLREVIPGLRRLAIMANSDNPSAGLDLRNASGPVQGWAAVQTRELSSSSWTATRRSPMGQPWG
jgi:hypothetical protein